MDVMSEIVERAQQLAKDKIARLPITGNQEMGPPTMMNPPIVTAGQSSTDKMAKECKKTQQYADWDKREYTSSKDSCQKRVEARDKQWTKAQMESAKRDMLVYKQMVLELKMVLKMEKEKKVRKAIIAEIAANEDIIKMLICPVFQIYLCRKKFNSKSWWKRTNRVHNRWERNHQGNQRPQRK